MKPKRHSYAATKAWRKANREKHLAQMKRWREKNPGKLRSLTRAIRRKQLSGPVPYEPPEHCEACGRKLIKPNLDHCHLTGLFRGWLCNPCNAALGMVGDSPEGVRRLLKYIESAYDKLQSRLEKP